MNVGQRIKQRREELNMSAEELGAKIGKAKTTIYRYELGLIEKMPTSVLKDIANALFTTPAYLMGWDNIEPVKFNRNVIKVPIYGEIPAGVPIEMIENSFIEDYEEVDADLARGGKILFGLKIKGDSMYPEFRDGDNIIFLKTDTCENGAYCAVSINGTECTFKKVIRKENGITLMPLNSAFEPMFYTNQEIIDLPITILGVVKEVRRTY